MQRNLNDGEKVVGTLSPTASNDDSPIMRHHRGEFSNNPFASKEIEGLMSVVDIASEDESKLTNRSQQQLNDDKRLMPMLNKSDPRASVDEMA